MECEDFEPVWPSKPRTIYLPGKEIRSSFRWEGTVQIAWQQKQRWRRHGKMYGPCGFSRKHAFPLERPHAQTTTWEAALRPHVISIGPHSNLRVIREDCVAGIVFDWEVV